MKFHLEAGGTEESGGRLGKISDIAGRHAAAADGHLQTPLCMVYTRGGSVPHLTQDVLKRYGLDRHIAVLQVSLPTLLPARDAIKHAGGLANFINSDKPLFVSTQDPAENQPRAINADKFVCVPTRCGNFKFNAMDYVTLMAEFAGPPVGAAAGTGIMWECPADSDSERECSDKRVLKCISRSLRHLDHSQLISDSAQSQENGCCRRKVRDMFAAIQGGYNVKLRRRSAVETVKNTTAPGFVFEGFANYGPEGLASFQVSAVEKHIKVMMEELPVKGVRLLQGPLSPRSVLQAVELGLDLFDSSYAYLMAEKGCVTTFPLDCENGSGDARQLYLNLHDIRYQMDLSPPLAACSCLTCSQFTRAYIHHLLHTKELLASVLIMGHNLMHWLAFFRKIRQCLQDGTFQTFKAAIISCDDHPS